MSDEATKLHAPLGMSVQKGTNRLGSVDIDLVMIGLMMTVTVPRVGWWMARWEQPDLWFVGYAAAIVFDLAILRLSYVWKRSTWRRQQAITGGGFLFFASCSGLFQTFYLLTQKASLLEAVPLAAIWPVGLCILALHKAAQDDRQERQDLRAQRRLASIESELSGRTGQQRPGQRATWTDEQRREALRLAGAGQTIRQVAGQLGIPKSTVGGWIKEERLAATSGLKQRGDGDGQKSQ